MVLDTSLLNTRDYKVRIKIKVEQSRGKVAPFPKPRCSNYGKGSIWVAIVYGRQLYFLYSHAHTHIHTHIYIYIYIYVYVCVCVCEREGWESELNNNRIAKDAQQRDLYVMNIKMLTLS